MDILKYKGYEGTGELDMTRKVCRGKVLFINDLVTYEADSPAGLEKEFEAAVDDYLETCAELGREPQKPLGGVFQVRTSPDLHRAAVLRAVEDSKATEKVTLNDVVTRALDAYLHVRADVNHNVSVTVKMEEGAMHTLVASTDSLPRWETGLVRH